MYVLLVDKEASCNTASSCKDLCVVQQYTTAMSHTIAPDVLCRSVPVGTDGGTERAFAAHLISSAAKVLCSFICLVSRTVPVQQEAV